MDLHKLIKRYFAFLQVPSSITRGVNQWLTRQLDAQGWVGAHLTLKRACAQLRLWLLSRAAGTRCIQREPWVLTTDAGFPRILSGLQDLPTTTLWILTALHKVFRPNHVCDLSRKAILKKIDDVRRPSEASRFAIADALSLIELGVHGLTVPDWSYFSSQYGSIYEAKHEVTTEGLQYLNCFYHKNACWLEPISASTCFVPFSVRSNVEMTSNGTYQYLQHGDRLVTALDPTFTRMGEYQMAAEPGNKPRAYFAPNLLLKVVDRPLFEFLEEMEKVSGYSVRYLPSEGRVAETQKWLMRNESVDSIDQSSATDRFPLRLQLYFAYLVGVPKEYIRFVARVSRGVWGVASDLRPYAKSDTIRLSCGQPMGIPFSMPLYTMTMVALLRGACRRWGYEDNFNVLGDDLVVGDPGLARWCLEFLPKIGVVLSTSKGVTSTAVAEFAGAYIYKDAFCFPGKMPVPERSTWYSISVNLHQPIPDGSPSGDRDKVETSFWLSRLAALGCSSDLTCPINNGIVSNQIIQRNGFTQDVIDNLWDKLIVYKAQRVFTSASSLSGRVRKGLIQTRTEAITRILLKLVPQESLMGVQGNVEHLLCQGLKMAAEREIYSLSESFEPLMLSRLSTALEPKGRNLTSLVTSLLDNVTDIADDFPKWSITYPPAVNHQLLERLTSLVDGVRDILWESRKTKHKADLAEYNNFCTFLLKH